MPIVESCEDVPMTTIEGLSYIASMRRSAEIGSLFTLREMISELVSRDILGASFLALVSFCERGLQFESVYGRDCLLDLQHCTVKTLVESGVIATDELIAISARQATIAKDLEAAKIARSLRLEGRRL